MAPDTRELTLATNQRAPHQQTREQEHGSAEDHGVRLRSQPRAGKHLADQFTSRGAGVHGGARKPGTLDTSTGVIPVQLDITDPASVTAAAAAAPDTTLEEEVS